MSSIKSRIQRATGLHVEMDNVANACALSEVWFGDSDGLHDLVVVNVSEGIGTGIFANGQLLRGANGMAGEFGHVQMDTDWSALRLRRPRLLGDGQLRIARPPLLRGVQWILQRRKASLRLLRWRRPMTLHAIKALEKMSTFLGRGLRMIASALSPSEIVIVGDITTAWYMFGPIVEAELKQNALSKEPRLRPSFEGNTARLRSAVALVMNGSLVSQIKELGKFPE